MNAFQLLVYAISLLLITLPLPFAINNIALGVFLILCLVNFKKLKFTFNWAYVLLILLFLWACLSIAWSYDQYSSIKAISKYIPLLVLPLSFLFLPTFSKVQRNQIFTFYAYGISFYMLAMLINAVFNYIKTNEASWFFYHDLVSLKVNAIYVSAFVAMALLFLIQIHKKTFLDWACIVLLFGSLVLLSSKNLLFITFILIVFYFIKNYKNCSLKKVFPLILITVFLVSMIGGYSYNRYKDEFRNVKENVILENGIESISLYNAWYQESFDRNTYFNGSTFRIHQLRLLNEFITEYPIFWQGFGLNASQDFLTQKQKNQDLVEYYWDLNFHNQYAQTFAELGIIGFLLLMMMIVYSMVNAIRNKDFYALCFTLLIFSFFLTESPLSRQRGIVFIVGFYCILNQRNRYLSIK